jgi:hypothetical protein
MNIKLKKNGRIVAVILFALCVALFGYKANAWEPNTDKDFDKDTIWGVETNCLKAGLLLQYAPDTNHTLVGFYPVLNNSSTTNGNADPDHLWLWLPPFDSRYQMQLTDINGNSVPKTAKGKALGKLIDQPLELRMGVNFAAGYRGQIIRPNSPDVIPTDPFVLEDYFTITNAGNYHLKFEMHVIWMTNGWKGSLMKSNPPAMWLLPVNAEIEIKNP